MKARDVVASTLVVALAAAPPGAAAVAPAVGDWRAVTALPRGTPVVVRLDGERTVKGKLVGAVAMQLVVDERRGRRFITCDDVMEVRTAPRSLLRRSAAVMAGLLAGLAYMVFVGMSGIGCDPGCGLPDPRSAFRTGFLIAALGGLVGLARAEKGGGVLVYRAPPEDVNGASAPSSRGGPRPAGCPGSRAW